MLLACAFVTLTLTINDSDSISGSLGLREERAVNRITFLVFHQSCEKFCEAFVKDVVLMSLFATCLKSKVVLHFTPGPTKEKPRIPFSIPIKTNCIEQYNDLSSSCHSNGAHSLRYTRDILHRVALPSDHWSPFPLFC